MKELIFSALPWLIGGVSLGVLARNMHNLKGGADFEDGKNINDTFAGEATLCGMMIGLLVSMVCSVGLLFTIVPGILAGLAFGTSFKKRKR